jgi:hypothetical protein
MPASSQGSENTYLTQRVGRGASGQSVTSLLSGLKSGGSVIPVYRLAAFRQHASKNDASEYEESKRHDDCDNK